MKKKYIWIVVGVLAVGGGYFWYSKSNSDTAQVRYVTAEVERGTLTSSISATGSIVVDDQATVDPTITGTVSGLAVKVGDEVKKGQFLFNIINDDLSVNVAKSAVSYESAKNSLESAKIDRDDAKAKYEKAKDEDDDNDDVYTKKELEVLKDKVSLADAKIFQAEKNLSAAGSDYQNEKTNAGKRKVTAPISGTVQEVNVKNGDDLSRTSSSDNSSAPIIIGDIKTLKAEVEVNEVDIAGVSVGQKTKVSLDAFSGTEFSGKVEKIDSLGTVEQGVVSYKVIVAFDTLDPRIKPDMSVAASISAEVKQDTLMIPSSALKNKGDNYYVEILKNGIPEQKTVKVGIDNSTQTEIIGGVSVGDKVVTQTINSGSKTSSTSSSSKNSSSSNSSLRIPGVTGGGPGR